MQRHLIQLVTGLLILTLTLDKEGKIENSTAYYKYMLVYVDDVLHLAKDTQEDMWKLNQAYQLREGFGPPYIYLGADIDKVELQDGKMFWSMNCAEYLRGSIKKVDLVLEGNKVVLKSFGDGKCPYPSSYRPYFEVTNELDAEFINRFQQLIGFLRWSIELGRIYIMTEVSCLYQHLCSPREGHLNAV